MDLPKVLSWLYWLSAVSVGSFVPGYGYFASYEPPFFSGAGLILTPFAAILVVAASLYTPRRAKASPQSLLRKSLLLVVVAVALLVVYAHILAYCTACAPRENGARYQIGFGKSEWSLTEVGVYYKKGIHGSQPVEDWMLREGAFRDGGPEILWKLWSIHLAGAIVAAAYLVAFMFWIWGIALFARFCVARKATPPEKI